MMTHYNYSLTELEEKMMPFERDIYVSLLIEHTTKKENK